MRIQDERDRTRGDKKTQQNDSHYLSYRTRPQQNRGPLPDRRATCARGCRFVSQARPFNRSACAQETRERTKVLLGRSRTHSVTLEETGDVRHAACGTSDGLDRPTVQRTGPLHRNWDAVNRSSFG